MTSTPRPLPRSSAHAPRRAVAGRLTPLARALLPVCLSLAAGVALAATPGAGELLRDNAPRPPVPAPAGRPAGLPTDAPKAAPDRATAGLRVTLTAVHLTGVLSLRREEVEALLTDAVGREFDFDGLQALADRVTTHYRERGFLLARAFLPAQRLSQGVLEIEVLEGRLDRIAIAAAAPVREDQVRPYFAGVGLRESLRNAPLEAGLLRLSDLPGVRVQSVLRPGELPGTTLLDVQVDASTAFTGSATLDNQGNRSTGRTRASLNLNRPGLLGLGDAADLSLSTSGAGLQYARLGWATPVGGNGLQLGAAGSLLHYRLGADFSSVDASGRADELSLFGQQSLLRSRLWRVDGQFGLDLKRFDDQQGSGLSAITRNHKRIQLLNAGVAVQRDAPGWRAGSLSLGLGQLNLDPSVRAADAAGERTQGAFAKLSASSDFLVDLATAWTGSLRLRGQWANQNLDSAEKFALGGPQAVRAYGAGEGSSNEALLLSAELARAALFEALPTTPMRFKLFVDAASGRVAKNPLPSALANQRSLAAAGIGLDVSLPASLLLQASAAQPIGHDAGQAVRGPRVWLLLGSAF